MAPRLRVLVSTTSSYPPTTICAVNSTTPAQIDTPGFKGQLSVFVRGYHGEGKDGEGDEYFGVRDDMTYGIVVRGRFLDDVGGDDVLFGNVFENPIKDHLPWGTSIATKFMYFVDPTLELDVYADKPWALSPALSTMSKLALVKAEMDKEGDTTESSHKAVTVEEDALPAIGHEGGVAARRKWFGTKVNRDSVSMRDYNVSMEFSNGLLDFNTLSATLPPPFKLSIPLLKYWDGQPVTYVCRRRSSNPVSAEGVYWSVAFEIVDEEAKRELEEKKKKKSGEKAAVAEDEDEGEDGDVGKSDAGVSKAEEAALSEDID